LFSTKGCQSIQQANKTTKSISAIKIRKAIATSKDPEETFFDAFPSALGISLSTLQQDKSKLQSYTTSLQKAIRKRTANFL
jgi:hypothetical protein